LIDKQFQQGNTTNYFNIETLNEFNLGNFLDSLRAKYPGFLRPSFETICSIGPNGSVIHYKAKEETAKKIEANNLLLLDSGGHYVDMGKKHNSMQIRN
jgi:Xaa-Pro aminopeptidase